MFCPLAAPLPLPVALNDEMGVQAGLVSMTHVVAVTGCSTPGGGGNVEERQRHQGNVGAGCFVALAEWGPSLLTDVGLWQPLDNQ